MVIIYHQKSKVKKISIGSSNLPIPYGQSISKTLINIAKDYPEELLIWCHESYKAQLNIEGLGNVFQHKKVLASYGTSKEPYLTEAIGFVNKTAFINLRKNIVYPTWLMSSDVGGVRAEVLLALEKDMVFDHNFDYFLNSMAKLCMSIGLFCYSNPKFLKGNIEIKSQKAGNQTLFRFVKQHYKIVWVFLLFVNIAWHDKKFPFLALALSLFYKRRTLREGTFNHIHIETLNTTTKGDITLDVIIPTIGRKMYLYNVLKDLSNQTQVPKNVIIVEQNPELDSKSELDYITSEEWPFKIKHHFIHKTGACNARNIALNEVESDWVFLADDDIVLNNNFIENAANIISKTDYKAFTFSCYLKGQKPEFELMKQWDTFGSGCSIVKRSSIKDIFFSMAFEHGFGEDGDFGMQLRNKGIDIVYAPEPSILHLKAPVGGFRTKPNLIWQKGNLQPKPSPVVMLFFIKHYTKKQVSGYKTILFFKYYKLQSIKNPFRYYRKFMLQWTQSQFWANTLKEKYS